MPLYAYVCKECGARVERISSDSSYVPMCDECGEPMRRDWRAEGFVHDFHPTRDLYGEKVAKQAESERKAGRGLHI